MLIIIKNHAGNVMITVLALSAVDQNLVESNQRL